MRSALGGTFVWALLASQLALSGCSLEPGASGSNCVRTTQCAVGLACVQGRCSNDLQAIADESTVPAFESADAATEAAVGDAATDAASASDANMSNGGAGGGGAGTGSDAAVPGTDAAMSGDDAG